MGRRDGHKPPAQQLLKLAAPQHLQVAAQRCHLRISRLVGTDGGSKGGQVYASRSVCSCPIWACTSCMMAYGAVAGITGEELRGKSGGTKRGQCLLCLLVSSNTIKK